MSCNHKFQSYLDLERTDFKPTTLIVGTFIPEWPVGAAEWFYGRTTKNYFWEILPLLYGEASLINASPAEWKQFCHDNKIALTDLISAIDDAEPGNPDHTRPLVTYADDAIIHNFDDFTFTDIVRLLRKHTTIQNVYFTRGITEVFWRHLWNPVAHYCSIHKLHERKLLTPSAAALYQHESYNTQNPAGMIPRLEDYILMRWQEEWHFG